MKGPIAKQHASEKPGYMHSPRFAGPAGRPDARLILFVALLSAVLMLSAVQPVFAGQSIIKDEGMLTSVEKDLVFIDNRGYLISRSTRVMNMDGKRIRIEEMQVPVTVRYKYAVTSKGMLIRSMQAIGE